MSLRTRLRIAIVTLVAFIVVVMSALYLRDFMNAALKNASDRARLIADNVKGYVLDRFGEVMAQRTIQPASLDEYKQAWTEIVKTDPLIADMLLRTRANSPTVGNIGIAGEDGLILAAADPSSIGRKAPTEADIDSIQNNPPLQEFYELFRLRHNFAFVLPLGVKEQPRPIFTLAILIDSLFLRHALMPAFQTLGYAFVGSLFVSVLLGFWLPNLVLRPLERVSQRIDEIRAGAFTPEGARGTESREFADVQSKLNLLGQQYRGAREDALALRTNIDQLVKRLQEAVLLFDSSGHLVVAGQMVEHLLGQDPKEMLGRALDDLFPPSLGLGATINAALLTHRTIQDELLVLENQTRVLVNIEPLDEPGKPGAGVLVRLRDAETHRQLQQQLDLSSRLAAITRLTGGVAHEIKNPLNAITLHLEVLKNRLDGSEPEIDIISGEIQRLDRVVKTFLDFNRPIELQVRDFDLSKLAAELASLLSHQAELKKVTIEARLAEPLWIRGDQDLLRQGILNVLVNGIEALAPGGHLLIQGERSGAECLVTISDDGPGIPTEIQKKIFNLYFTTKEKGTGIGLAMTFRLVQLHSGTIDVFSEPGRGAAFRFSFPAAVGPETVSKTRA